MNRTKTIKRKTRNRLILLQNLKKGKARKEPRCGYQLIPCPLKFASASQLHYLYADVVLMEQNDTLVTEASLLNNSKIYKNVQVVTYPTQKVLRIKVENKNTNIPPTDWKSVVEKLENSESNDIRQWADSVKTYCERYEVVVKELQREQYEMTTERFHSLNAMNEKTEKTRQNIIKTYPCIEFKSQLKDGQIQLTEISISEKYIKELGYTLDEFSATVLQEGLPEMTPLNSNGATSFAKIRLQKYLTTDQDGYQTPEFESSLIMKNGCMKKIKLRVHYHTCYEKGVSGFVFIGAMVAKQKPFVREVNPVGEIKLNADFINFMSNREKDMNYFLSTYYNQPAEQKFTNIHKVCKVKEIKALEEI